MSFIAPVISALGTVTSAVGQIQQGNAADAVAKQNADRSIEDAQIKEQQQRLADTRTLATARAITGASGVEISGSPLDVMAESARQAEMNALIIRRGGQLDAQAQLQQGANIKAASRTSALSTILTGTANISKQVAVLGATKKSTPATPTTSYDPNSGLEY